MAKEQTKPCADCARSAETRVQALHRYWQIRDLLTLLADYNVPGIGDATTMRQALINVAQREIRNLIDGDHTRLPFDAWSRN